MGELDGFRDKRDEKGKEVAPPGRLVFVERLLVCACAPADRLGFIARLGDKLNSALKQFMRDPSCRRYRAGLNAS